MVPLNATLTQLTFPASPLDLQSARDYLRLETSDDDGLITDLIEAATQIAIHRLGRSLLNTSWELRLDALRTGGLCSPPFLLFPALGLSLDNSLQLPRPPLVSVDQISYLDQGGVATTLDLDNFVISTGTPGRIGPAYGSFWPFSIPQINAVTVRYQAGYGTDPGFVPRNIISAIRLIVVHLYEHRSDDAPIPTAVEALLSPSVWPSYA